MPETREQIIAPRHAVERCCEWIEEMGGSPLAHNRHLFDLGKTFTVEGKPFTHAVLSWGRAGDTCAFPATSEGKILDFCGFGFGLGPSRWIMPDEFDDYIADCIAAAESGRLSVAPEGWVGGGLRG